MKIFPQCERSSKKTICARWKSIVNHKFSHDFSSSIKQISGICAANAQDDEDCSIAELFLERRSNFQTVFSVWWFRLGSRRTFHRRTHVGENFLPHTWTRLDAHFMVLWSSLNVIWNLISRNFGMPRRQVCLSSHHKSFMAIKQQTFVDILDILRLSDSLSSNSTLNRNTKECQKLECLHYSNREWTLPSSFGFFLHQSRWTMKARQRTGGSIQ